MITITFKASFYSLARIGLNLELNSIGLDIFCYIFCYILLFCIKQ